MLRVAITGAAGVMGTILRKALTGSYQLTLIDLIPIGGENTIILDVAQDYNHLVEILRGHDVVIHLARDDRGSFKSGDNWVPENDMMIWNVYRACIEGRVKRVIMASSVHAVDFLNYSGGDLISPYSLPNPDTPYGAMKIFMEAMGMYFAYKRGLQVICIRFGGINLANEPSMPDEAYYPTIWLSHEDYISLVRKCIDTQNVPNKFVIIYGVSNNLPHIFDNSNPFGWAPGGRC